MHAGHATFLEAIAARRRLSVRFFSRKEGRELTRICAPLDFGPLRGALPPVDHYQLWDLERKRKPLNLALLEGDIVSMTPLEETFEPRDIITWAFKPGAWHVPRDWAEFS
jgi:hypothetical protein